jgi:hypothetical protein
MRRLLCTSLPREWAELAPSQSRWRIDGGALLVFIALALIAFASFISPSLAGPLAQCPDATYADLSAYKLRLESAKKAYSNFHEVAESSKIYVSDTMACGMILSEMGPEMQIYFGLYPSEADRIMHLAKTVQLMELGSIAESLRSAKTKHLRSDE